ncbi:MAG TPA: hypothetical protein ENI52_01290 [Thermoplasmata archaeon]|nr:hypothetical protein [Thermoplasmata archaeon]
MNKQTNLKILICVIIICVLSINCVSASLKGMTPEAQDFLNKARKFPLNFNVAKSEEYNTWGRAQSFVAKVSSMKIQIVSDFIIETYNPSHYQYGYRIVKTPLNDSIQISVLCIPGEYANTQLASDYAHICAYFIKTGDLPPGIIIGSKEESKIKAWHLFVGLTIIAIPIYILLHNAVY